MKKKIIRNVIVLGIGFAVAMIIMAVVIFLGYSDAYRTGNDSYSVNIFGLHIYELCKTNDAYTGTSEGLNMGIFCVICMALAFIIEKIVISIRHK